MSTEQTDVLVRQIRRLVGADAAEPRSDRELLYRYAQGDEAAFAALVGRHGPMVWHVCRRGLGHHQDAEDVYQATFLVLAKKAGSVGWRASVAAWLYAVARRLACKARSAAARRPTPVAAPPSVPDPLDEMSGRDLLAVLDDEVAALPESCRGPVVLCLVEGHTQEQTAGLLGTSLSTVRRRLDRGKAILHARLTRRGLAPTLGALALAGAAAVPPPVAASARALALAETFLAVPVKLKLALVLLLVSTVLAGLGLALAPARSQPSARQASPPADETKDPLPEGVVMRLGTMRLRHSGTSFVVAWSPDGKTLASGGWDNSVRLWDPATGKERRQLTGPAKGLNAIAWSPDGKHLTATGLEGGVFVWDPATGELLRRFGSHQGQVQTLAISPKGDVLATGDTVAVRLWDFATGKALRSLEVGQNGVYSLAISPDGKAVAAGGEDRTLRVWEVPGGKLLYQPREHTGWIGAVAYAPDGKRLATAGSDQVLVWDAATGKKWGAMPGRRGGNRCAFSPDGKVLAVGSGDNAVCLFDWAEARELRKLPRHPDHLRSLAYSPDGKVLATVSDAAAIHLWDPASGKPLLPLPGHQGRLNSVACSADGRTIATAAWDGTVRLWDARIGDEKRRFEVEREDQPRVFPLDAARLSQVALSPDGKLVAAVRGDEIVQVWDIATGKEARRFRAGTIAFSPDGSLIACGERGITRDDANAGIIRLYDRATGKQVREMRGHLTVIASLRFAPDGKTLYSQGTVLLGMRTGEPGESETRFARAWDVATGKERPAVPGGQGGESVEIAPDGRTVARTGRRGETITVWEMATGGRRAELAGHADMIFSVAYSPDGRTLASGSMDGTVRLWDLVSGKELAKLEGHRGWVLSVAWTPDGKRLVSGSLDTTALVWAAAVLAKRPAPTESTAAELEAAWKDLLGDAAASHRALGRLVDSGGKAVTLLRDRLRPAAPPDPKRLAKWIAELDSDRFAVREEARKKLEEQGDLAAAAIRKALAAETPLDVKRRLEAILDKLDGVPSAEVLRQVRAVEALEHIGDADARRLLEELAGGVAEARQTREARAALARLDRR